MKKTLIILLVFIAALMFASPARPVYNLSQIEALKGRAVEKIFLRACKTGDINTVKLIIKSKHKNVVFSAENKHGWTGLIAVLMHKKLDIARLLVKISRKYQPCMSPYITRKSNPEAGGSDALLISCYYADLDLIKMLIKKGALINSTDTGGSTPLMNAAFFGRTQIVKYLFSKGAYINARNGLGFSALHNAMANSNSYECIMFLIKAGTDPNIQDFTGDTALHLVVNGSLYRIKNHNLKLKILEELLKRGANPNIRNIHGNTPLMNVVIFENPWRVEAVKLLLKYGASVSLRDRDGFSILSWAAHPDVRKLLIAAGARR